MRGLILMLERLGYTVTVRSDSLDAMAIFEDRPESFDLVITDQTMPGITGVDPARSREVKLPPCSFAFDRQTFSPFSPGSNRFVPSQSIPPSCYYGFPDS